MQMVIIAGGLATRLRPLSLNIPKSMIPIAGKPFLQHQLELVRAHGIKKVVLCVGHLSELIVDYFGSGEKLGLSITYSFEGDQLLGTGGALKKAEPLLDNIFFVMWGDSYLLLDYEQIWDAFFDKNTLGLMVVYNNNNTGDRSNVKIGRGLVVDYNKWNPGSTMHHIDNGLSILNKKVVDTIPSHQPYQLEKMFQHLAHEGQLAAYETTQGFFEIGSHAGLDRFQQYVAHSKAVEG